jgi:DNA-binding protein H-NS
MDINLNEMSLREVQDLKKKVDSTIANFEERKLREARVELEIKAREMGFSLADLLAVEGKVKLTRKPAVPKWRHRENHEATWSGRGRKPQWFDHAELIPNQE